MHVESFKFQNRILIANHDAQQSIKEKDSPLFLNFPASRGFFFSFAITGLSSMGKETSAKLGRNSL